MDVEELLNYQPNAVVEDEDRDDRTDTSKGLKRKFADLEELERKNKANFAESLDENALKRLITQFERKLYKNQELRIKFSDEPTKFLDSEMELFDCLQEMNVLSTQPELYQTLVDGKVVGNLLGLLSHENADISVAVVTLLHELIDLDNNEELDHGEVLSQALIDGQIVVQLVSLMQRLDESVKEESDAVHYSLAIIENLLDFQPELAKDCLPLITWILSRLKRSLEFDSNKLYVVEILSILLQNNEDNRRNFGIQDGIDCLLRQVAYYKRREPSSPEEQEYTENLFNCLCSALLCDTKNRELFFTGEGIELMNLILREKTRRGCYSPVKFGAIKVVGHALSKDKAKDEFLVKCCDRFVETYGLRALFPIFMQPKSIIQASKKKKEMSDLIDEVEEHCLSIILAILKNARTENRARCAYKFVETDYEKTEKLIELHFKYADKVIKCEKQISKEKARLMAEDEEVDEEEFFLRRLSSGLFTLQLIDQIIILISAESIGMIITTVFRVEQQIRNKVHKLMGMRSSVINHRNYLRQVIKELIDNEPEEEDKETLFCLLEQF